MIRQYRGALYGMSLSLAMPFGFITIGHAQSVSPVEQSHHHHGMEVPAGGSMGSAGAGPSDMDSRAPPSSKSTEGGGEGESQVEHVPPDPPQQSMEPMSYGSMAAMMQMDDRQRRGKVLLDQLEWRAARGANALVWDAQAWYGGDYDKAVVKTEGERTAGATEDARVELLWDRIFSRWWSIQAGARQDFSHGPERTWAAIGIQGLAPYWLETEATLYVGDAGRSAARVKLAYELLFTQRLVLQPELEANFYGATDRARRIGAGLSDIDAGLRLRYEIRREFAPYVGVAWRRKFGGTADFARQSGTAAGDTQFTAGVRVWF